VSFTGLIPAAYTPFDESGALSTAVLAEMAELFRAQGIGAVFVAGTTGESVSLTTDERRRLTEAWMDIAGGLKVITHVGGNCQADCVELARHAAGVGVAAAAAMAPSYFRPRDLADLIDFMEPIAAAAGDTPFYFYDIPGMTGVELDTVEFLHEGRRRIPTLRGVKFTRDDLGVLSQCLGLDGGSFDILFGQDELLLSGIGLGVRGAVGSTYNYAAPVYTPMFGGVDDSARRQELAGELIDVLIEFGVLPAGKAIMSMIGIDCGGPRSPLPTLTLDERRSLYERILHLDIFSGPLREPTR
jgi:N-acetylneuraminate lyase